MSRWATYAFVAESLRLVLGLPGPTAVPPDLEWEQIVSAASHHLVTPTLGWCWRDADWVPPEIRDYFTAALELNRARNGTLRQGLELAVRALNAAGMTPVLLKGAAILSEPLYPDDGIRFMGDLDLLVPESALEPAARALAAVGFESEWAPPLPLGKHHHLPGLEHRQFGAGVELHRWAVPRRLSWLLDTGDCLDRARFVSRDGLSFAIPSPSDRIAHIVGSQVRDGHYGRGVPLLRQMLDVARLAQENPRAVVELQTRYRGARAAAVARTTLDRCNVLLAVPEADHRQSARCQRRMRRAIGSRDRVTALGTMKARLMDAPAYFRESPGRLLRLAFPAVWWRFLHPPVRRW